ncbi:Fe(3+)-hydroxamate ABC transporter permease FhuB [Rhizobium sp. TRM95796]|uniref:Fe(3+)-hydroxamate ABC transporter permease FhuB n=1 Tax=Rhizobium sp. TRM95796 TaxID=2979862 RepID=UPI0021E8F71A|nr:Fe(3+)-hydroxamate ABC transporter permease FhuB [Rhizobium sp. TRM95796]MCV3764501.1 Fe(3+)-hydroxamate ABC transporter permease FhuB [Rhizobium sp. TRM95796]
MTLSAFDPRRSPLALTVTLMVLAGLLVFSRIDRFLALDPSAVDYEMARLVFLNAALPRIATALMVGAALSLSGAILQQALRNPLASPTTLGIAAGAQLALAATMLYAPALLSLGRDGIALVGSAVAAGLVFLIGARRGLTPFSLVLSGMVISLWCGALSAILILMNDRYLVGLYVWGAGSLSQQSWAVPLALAPKLAILSALAFLVIRPLGLLDLGEEGAAGRGLSIRYARFAAVAIAVTLAAVATAAVGVIGFIGLVAPLLARISGARRPLSLFVWSSLIGAALLTLTDAALVAMLGDLSDSLPTGAVTAVFGSPLLLILLPRLKTRFRASAAPTTSQRSTPGWTPVLAIVLATLIIVIALFVGRGLDGGFELSLGQALYDVMPYRAPRIFAAIGAGAMLAVAGVILQRLTGNEMASPEVLGISAGATMGMALSLLVVATPVLALQLGFAGLGAGCVLLGILAMGRRSGFAAERVLLTGVAISAMADALSGALSAMGDPRGMALMRWMSGSTYAVDVQTAVMSLVAMLVLVALATLARRWLQILPLGPAPAQALGLALPKIRLALYALAALLTAAATLTVGPMSFIGLMAPHLAREAGLRHAGAQTLGAALIGAALMALADWCGRMLAFPYQIPAGLVSAMIGAPMLALLMNRRRG